MRRLAGFAAGILLGVVVIACADAGADDIGERIETPGDFDDVYTFCSHGNRVFITETDTQASSAIAVAPRNGAGGNGC